MKNRIALVASLCIGFCTGTVKTEDKKVSKTEVVKSELSLADVMSDTSITLDASIRVVETFTVMGEGEPGQMYRKEIETKRDLATEVIREESKKIEKAKNEYVSKATTMTDAARDKEEKRLMKMNRDLESMASEKEEELKMDMQSATEVLVQATEVAVAEYAQQEGIDIIFDKMTGRALYVSEKFDITDKIITRVNKNHQIKLAQNKKQQDAVKVADNKKTVEKTVKS